MTRIALCIGFSAGLAITALAAAGVTTRSVPPSATPRTTVVAELFTSEGCSSCPPADALLRRLLADQPVDGVEVIALGNHVDYWDRLGWRDPFSSALFSERQSVYGSRVFGSDRIYTPQLVVDGRLDAVGNNEPAVRKAILEAARTPHATVDLSVTPASGASVRIDVQVQVPDAVSRKGAAEIVVAVTEDGLTSHVQHGENGGRTLAHSAVVRLLKTVAKVAASDRTGSATLTVALAKDWNPDQVRLVAFVQETGSRRIVGAGSTRLRATAPAE